MKRRLSAALCALACTGAVFAPLAARADVPTARALSTNLVTPTTDSLRRVMDEIKNDRVAQANPVGTPQKPIHRPGLPQGFTYNVDASIAFPTNNPGFNTNDPGGIDAGFGIGLARWNRVQAGYYEIQQVPIGFANRNVPFYLQGFTGPGTALAGGLGTQNTGVVDVTTKDKILSIVDQNLFVIGGKLPIVISPTYISHWADVHAAGGRSDVQAFEYNGFPNVAHLRAQQEWILPLTLPFLSTPRMFGTATVAAQWLNHPNGVNQTNKAQTFLLGYLEYRASTSTTFFLQPSRLVQYNPVDPYPQYTPTLIYGLSHHFTKQTYVQMTALEGGASNYRQLGITSLTCQSLPCSTANTLPTFGGLKAAEVQIQFGIGSPTVIPL